MLYLTEADIKMTLNCTFFRSLRTALMAVCLLPVLAGPFYGAENDQILYTGTVSSFMLNIRTQPSQDADILDVAARGDRLDILEKQGEIGGWLTVLYKGQKGYIRNRPRYIILQPAPAVKKKKQMEQKPEDLKQQQTKKEKIEKELESQEKMVESFSQQEMEILEGLNEIDYALNKARIKVSSLSKEVQALGGKIDTLHSDQAELLSQIEQNRDYAGSRLRALYKMGMIGRIDATGAPGSVFDFFLTQNAMKQIIEADLNILERQNSDFKKFELLERELQKQVAEKADIETMLNDQIVINNKETLKRQVILKQIQQKKKLSLAAVESLKLAAIKLENKISDISQSSDAQTLDELSFSNFRGRLSVPAEGRIISNYGPSKEGDLDAFTFQKGIDIKVERGEPVKSIFRGKVMFAQWLQGYGNLLIIDHGDSYYSLYAHVEEIFKEKGSKVETGEVIATAGDTGSIKGLCLHFELRHHGRPVNPMEWLKKGA